MSTALPTDYQQYYVYFHQHPETGKVFYIGHGCNDRAWMFSINMTRHTTHREYLYNLVSLGFIPNDWVFIVKKGLSKEDAITEEKRLIEIHKPEFNYVNNPDYTRIPKDKVEYAKELKEQGIVGTQAAKLLEVSIMTTWRYQYEY